MEKKNTKLQITSRFEDPCFPQLVIDSSYLIEPFANQKPDAYPTLLIRRVEQRIFMTS